MEKSVIAGNIHHLQHQYFVIRLVDLYLKNESVDDKLVRLLGILCISSAETDNSSGYSTESYVDNQNTNNLVWEKYQNVTEALEKLKSLFNSVTTNVSIYFN